MKHAKKSPFINIQSRRRNIFIGIRTNHTHNENSKHFFILSCCYSTYMPMNDIFDWLFSSISSSSICFCLCFFSIDLPIRDLRECQPHLKWQIATSPYFFAPFSGANWFSHAIDYKSLIFDLIRFGNMCKPIRYDRWRYVIMWSISNNKVIIQHFIPFEKNILILCLNLGRRQNTDS